MVAFFVYGLAVIGLVVVGIAHPRTPQWVWEFSFITNILILSITSLLSFLVYRREQHYREVFFALWIVFAVFAVAGPLLALTEAIASLEMNVHFYVWYASILVHVTLAWAVTTITVGYLSSVRRRIVHSALASLALFSISIWLYSPYIFDPGLTIGQNDLGEQVISYAKIDSSSIVLNIFSLLMLLAFYVHKYRTDRPIGAYADTLLFLFGLALGIDTAEMTLRQVEFTHLVISQWGIMGVYGAMAVCLVLRLKFKSQTIADYYESQCLSDDPAIDRRIGGFDRLILRTFFDPEKVGTKVFLGTGSARMKVRRTPTPVGRRAANHG
ncbi:MAG: hypothetical protein IPK53_14895 [bacterium]|nr:hypothetical protein [bacterium]